jgi:phage tail-like protein
MNFEEWAGKVWNYQNSLKGDFAGSNQVVSLKDFRKDIVLQMFNEAGQLAISYNIYRCWVSEYQATPEFDAMGNSVAIQLIKLENEGWDRDNSVVEPTEPSFSLPAATP